MVKLDIGCGKNKKEGFLGMDQFPMEGVDIVWNIKELPWRQANGEMFYDNSVDEVHCSHFLEHLTGQERVNFYNELHRVLKPGGKATIITPHWASNRAYGDPTHQWPPVSEMSYYYLSQEWRDSQAPHTDIKWNPQGYSCNLSATWGYSFAPELNARNQEYVQFALSNYKEAVQDMHATLIKPLDKVAE